MRTFAQHHIAFERRLLKSRLMQLCTFLLLVCALILAPTAPGFANLVSKTDAKNAQAVFKAIDSNRFKDALKLTKRVKNPDLVRVLVWSYLSAANTPANFADVRAFLDTHPDWPRRDAMLKRAEETMPSSFTAKEVLAWFDKMGGPVSTTGKVRRAEALLKLGEKDRALAAVRDVWIHGNFTKGQEKGFYRRHHKRLEKADHLARLDRLIWAEKYWPARRQIWKVDEKSRKVAIARLWLMKREGNVDKAIADVRKIAPERLDEPGLVYERLRWRRRKGRTEDAADLLKDAVGDPVRPDKWWTERAILARTLMQKQKYKSAYDLTSRHALSPTDAADYADAEWMSGWIALRYLKNPQHALQHFDNMLKVVKFPISVARGAYWSARAATALGQTAKARTLLHTAAQHDTTYYGQLARVRLGQSVVANAQPPVPTDRDTQAFNAHSLKKALSILAELGLENRTRHLMTGLADIHDTPGWKRLSAAFAATHGRPDLAIRIAKRSERGGMPLGKLGYPQITPPKPKGDKQVELPLVLAVIRQESAFYAQAKSHAGARGLMQVMPATAKRVAKANRLPYSRDKLLKDPKYNLLIGQSYLADMVDNFDGSYPMALAAYNAGPHRVKRWIRTFGDPRDEQVDMIDWVEMIPYTETRNYVQRVLENLGVYRAHTTTAEVAKLTFGAQ